VRACAALDFLKIVENIQKMDIESKPNTAFRIGFLLIDGFALLSYAAAVEPLRAANLLSGRQIYSFNNISVSGQRAVSSSGAEIRATSYTDEPANADAILVVAGGEPLLFDDPQVFQWLRRLSRRGVLIGGVSGGPAILASAWVMAGHRMTVHWEHASALVELYPSLVLEKSLYVIDRTRMTCAGGIAAMDMMCALIASHQGAEFARQVSDWFIYTDIRPPGGPQKAGLAERFQTTNANVLWAIDLMESHIGDPMNLNQLAAVIGLGPRQLNRLFDEILGQSTMAFYRDLRLAKARSMLVQSSLSITEVALAAGFSTSAHFATAFRKRYAAPPSAMR
jgi:transcriptional regulator GlxA family with amidase domain